MNEFFGTPNNFHISMPVEGPARAVSFRPPPVPRELGAIPMIRPQPVQANVAHYNMALPSRLNFGYPKIRQR